MSIASEITRLQGVKSDILTAIADKCVTVPAGSALDDCPVLISSIPAGSNYKVIGGKEYRTVVMPDGKIWLAENLDFKFCNIGGSGTPSTPNAWYYNDNETTYGWSGYKCGLLYNWYAAKVLNDHRSELCPGWHVPSDAEWNSLFTACGGILVAGTKLKALDGSAGQGFPTNWNGTDEYGFGVLSTGYCSNGSFYNSSDYAGFWSANEYSSTKAYDIRFNTSASVSLGNSYKADGICVRLVRDAT